MELLEIMKIEQQERDARAFTQGAVPLTFQSFLKGTVRRKPGEGIGGCE